VFPKKGLTSSKLHAESCHFSPYHMLALAKISYNRQVKAGLGDNVRSSARWLDAKPIREERNKFDLQQLTTQCLLICYSMCNLRGGFTAHELMAHLCWRRGGPRQQHRRLHQRRVKGGDREPIVGTTATNQTTSCWLTIERQGPRVDKMQTKYRLPRCPSRHHVLSCFSQASWSGYFSWILHRSITAC
jgi:hypothetical protein